MEYMTFVLSVEEDGPAYMAGLRPGKSSTHVTRNIFALEARSIFPLLRCARIPAIPLLQVLFWPLPFPPLYFLYSAFCSSLKWIAEVGGFRRRV